ncbi:DUF2303 family protein [Agrobacterium genomosp. 3]|uniref:DUF2303 family protein n=1 Tax=Agrobacterium tomkonis TaxID=1183410 RepID=UPI001CD885ED|nr:DUF2303 family protein [Agrobacterium tomkonis]MCA1879341.1 DUF2303 family protein [Agrobacterium tumefaciens]MCA1894504.1 DUF2303 family protein [Agrobacterium tomkonis]
MEEQTILSAGLDIEALRKLADDAGSDITYIELDEAIDGLPTRIPALLDRKTGRIQSVRDEFERWRSQPTLKVGTARVDTLDSFIDLTARHKTMHSVIFADFDWQKPSLTAVIDYHENEAYGQADNGKHRIHYAFPLSEEWKAWTGMNARVMDQGEFAEFIEDHIPDLATPHEEEATHWQQTLGGRVATPADIITLSRGLKVFAETKVTNTVTLQSGEGQLTFEEEHKDANGQKINVPSLFIIRVPPFFRGESVRIPVRLRYRVKAGSIVWFYQLYKPDQWITEEVERAFVRAHGATELPGFVGKPEMGA